MLKRINWNFALPVLLLLLALLVSSWLLREKPTVSRGARTTPAPVVDVVEAERGRFPLTVKAVGKVSAREFVDLQPQVEGRVDWLDYDLGPGSTLEKNQLLLRIDAEPYQLALQTARSTLAERRAELQQEEGQRQVAEEEYALLGSSLPDADRALVLREPQLAAARARVESAEVQVSLARRDLRLTEIRSPFTGLLVSRSVDMGDRVAPGTVLYQLAGADRFQVEVEVPAQQLARLGGPDPEVRIHGSQWPKGRFRQAEFVRLIPVLEEQGRLARVLVELPDPLSLDDPAQPQLLLNDLARVEITGRTGEERVRVPLTAVQDGDRVWQVQENRIHIQPVEIAYLSGDYAVLESGLDGGETLVTTRLSAVTDGMPVRLSGEDKKSGETLPELGPPGSEGRPGTPPREPAAKVGRGERG
ncbi:efflux RND transporter periplasmic adaptor subunit [Microbulbifer rhizosphaerae]|uniref:RND family efflux transporter MFP subunit n=1 Tax=Microbulbifer rhizosphaerae TaxID=1562603 RepID=A0A7W4ZBC9_9GAMM|nr:efflux RND transporter periplasmic adaptor subunit [Microbulbifer rhizosphaerae]MBB3062264.1 RND family efflux transporter MFP subunit [Microbulbifer rhizosphaerae]